MTTGLLGYTGFVGGTLNRQFQFAHKYNTQNINEIKGESFDLLVCAAAPGKKWLANQEPEKDLQAIQSLMDSLKTCTASKLVLISTVDVYPEPKDVDENTIIDETLQHPYGKHRLLLEKFVSQHFVDFHILRLPALFGEGLKKNYIFDLIHDQYLDHTHPMSEFQFYDMENLWSDITRVIDEDLPLINIATEPIAAGVIAEKTRSLKLEPVAETKIVTYDFGSIYADKWQQAGRYLYPKDAIIQSLIAFIQNQRQQV